MKRTNSLQTDEIESLILNRGDEGVVLLKGGWGTGKTHFVRELLIPKLKENNDYTVIYITLIGAQDASEFEKRLASSQIKIIKNHNKLLIGAKIVGDVTSFFGKPTTAALAGLGNLATQVISDRIKDTIFIIDDLDRIYGKNRSEHQTSIAAKALSLVENNNNVRFLFVANLDEVYIDPKQNDKFFLPPIEFRCNHEYLISIIEKFSVQKELNLFLEDVCWTVFCEKTKHLESLRNLRVLQECAFSINRFLNEFKEVYDQHGYGYEESMISIVESIIALYHAHRNLGLESNTLREAMRRGPPMPFEGDDKDKNRITLNGVLAALNPFHPFSYYGVKVSVELFDFCFEGKHFPFHSDTLFLSPKGELSKLNALWNNINAFTEEDCELLTSKLRGFVLCDSESTRPKIVIWHRNAIAYAEFVSEGIIKHNNPHSIHSEIADKASKIFFDVDGVHPHQFEALEGKIGLAVHKALTEHFKLLDKHFAGLIEGIATNAQRDKPLKWRKASFEVDILGTLSKSNIQSLISDFDCEQLIQLHSLITSILGDGNTSQKIYQKEAVNSFFKNLIGQTQSVKKSMVLYNLFTLIDRISEYEVDSRGVLTPISN
jgi:hypothetical protein